MQFQSWLNIGKWALKQNGSSILYIAFTNGSRSFESNDQLGECIIKTQQCETRRLQKISFSMAI